MYQTMSQALPSIGTGLTHYFFQIRKFPILTHEEEIAYAKRWRDGGDREAAYHLVTSHHAEFTAGSFGRSILLWNPITSAVLFLHRSLLFYPHPLMFGDE